jgi:hypothetical protein
MDKYTMAVTSIPCPRESCTAALGQVCNTSAVVHDERRDAALAQGLWDPRKALAGEYGDLAGCPLEALKPVGVRRGRQPARPRNTAEPSGELSVGDVVAVGDVLLAVGRPAVWDPVTGPLTEVRTREHGTHPLTARTRLPDTADRATRPCPNHHHHPAGGRSE